jgi:hypothetical protein
MRLGTKTFIKIIASICFILVIAALLVIRNSPATGYESSIYRATPSLAWWFLIFSLLGGIGIVVHQVYHKKTDESRTWLIGLLLILISYTTVLSLYVMRGYMLWGRDDVLWHLRTTWDVIATGHVYGENYYPIAHIFTAQLSQILNIDAIVLFKYLPVLFALFYVAFIYLLARYVLPGRGQVLLATVVGLALIHTWYIGFGTSILSILMLPLAFYIGLRIMSVSKPPYSRAFLMLFIILIFLYPPFHMQPAIAIVFFIATIWIFPRIYLKLSRNPGEITTNYSGRNANTSIFGFVWWAMWISSFGIFATFIRNVRDLFVEHGTTPLELIGQDLSRTMGYGYDVSTVLDGFTRVYGSTLLLIIMALAAFPLITKKLSARKELIDLYSLYGPLLLFTLVIIGLFVSQNIFGPGRFFVYVIILCTVFTGFILYEIIARAQSLSQRHSLARLLPLAVVLVLGLVSVLGVFGVYPSPYTYSLSQQVTESELNGADFSLSHNDTSIKLVDYYPVGMRSFWYLMAGEDEKRSLGASRLIWEPSIPYHFGYDSNSYFGSSYNEDRYMVVNTRFRKLYTDVFPDMAGQRFLTSDFLRLEDDFSLDKVYTNGELDSWYVHGLGTTSSSLR